MDFKFDFKANTILGRCSTVVLYARLNGIGQTGGARYKIDSVPKMTTKKNIYLSFFLNEGFPKRGCGPTFGKISQIIP